MAAVTAVAVSLVSGKSVGVAMLFRHMMDNVVVMSMKIKIIARRRMWAAASVGRLSRTPNSVGRG